MSRAGWWDDLLRRARELELVGPLGFALRYSTKLLHTPVPDDVLAVTAPSRWASSAALKDMMFLRGFASPHKTCHLFGNALAQFVLYVRSHALRMPLHLLLPHLIYKAWLGALPAKPLTAEKN